VPDFDSVELAAAVRAVRDELVRAAEAAEDESVRFDVGEIQMEFEVELRHDAGAKGGFKAWVVSAGTDARVARGRTHRVAFTLTPKYATTGLGVEIGNNSPGDTGHFGPS
jgi:NTP-dependent ternary system trypsin peptidase co-occuring protein